MTESMEDIRRELQAFTPAPHVIVRPVNGGWIVTSSGGVWVAQNVTALTAAVLAALKTLEKTSP